MIKRNLIAGILGVILLMSNKQSSGDEAKMTIRYPEAPRSDTVDDYHGTRVADPYRPLEDPDAPATRAWIEAENKITFGFLERSRAHGRSDGV